jgi:hypothetical protein
MERFVHEENIRRYRKLLEEEKDEEKRTMIRKLLAEEEAKDPPDGAAERSEALVRPLPSMPNGGHRTGPGAELRSAELPAHAVGERAPDDRNR